MDDSGEGFGIEAGAADQGAVDFFFGHQRLGIFGLDGTAVKNSEIAGELLAKGTGGFAANQAVGLAGELGRRRFAGADRPHRLVRDDQPGSFLGRDFVEGAVALAAENIFGEAGFAFLQNFADADDWCQSGFEHGFQAKVDGVIGFGEILAALGMADDGMSAADGQQHGSSNFTRVGTFVCPVNILRADGDRGVPSGIERGMQIDERRANDDFIAVMIGDKGKKGAEEVAGLVGSLVHLPIGGNEFFTGHGFLFMKILTIENTEVHRDKPKMP
jgi:hypothetical protein